MLKNDKNCHKILKITRNFDFSSIFDIKNPNFPKKSSKFPYKVKS